MLPGSTTMSGANGKVVRGVRITGGPHETFGDSTVVVRYSGAKSWDRLVAVLAVPAIDADHGRRREAQRARAARSRSS